MNNIARDTTYQKQITLKNKSIESPLARKRKNYSVDINNQTRSSKKSLLLEQSDIYEYNQDPGTIIYNF